MNPTNKRPPIVLIIGALITVIAPIVAFATYSELQDHMYVLLRGAESYRASYEATQATFYISLGIIPAGFTMFMVGLIVSAIRDLNQGPAQ